MEISQYSVELYTCTPHEVSTHSPAIHKIADILNYVFNFTIPLIPLSLFCHSSCNEIKNINKDLFYKQCILSVFSVPQILPNVKATFKIKVLIFKILSYSVLSYHITICKHGKLRSQVFCNSWHGFKRCCICLCARKEQFQSSEENYRQAQYP